MYVDIQIIFINILFNVHNAFFTFGYAIGKCLHSGIQITMVKNTVQRRNPGAVYSAWFFQQILQFLCPIIQCLCDPVHTEHAAKKSGNIYDHHNSQENKVIKENSPGSLSHIQSHAYGCCQNCHKQKNIYYFFPHNQPP